MFSSIIVLIAVSISSLTSGEQINSVPSKPQQYVVEIGNGGGGTSNFNPSCGLTPKKAAVCWGYWGG
jgi:hypothetical protein